MNDRPFVLVNVAMTADGKLDSYLRKGATISSGQDKTRVDQLRAKMDAILVGGKTLVQEDPELTVIKLLPSFARGLFKEGPFEFKF